VRKLWAVSKLLRSKNVTSAPVETGRPLVAVIEDDCAARKAIGRLLRVGNYEPALFDCAEAFMTRPPQPSPACVIIDIQLPGLSGLDLQQRMRESGSRVPVIFTTANRDAAVRENACRQGCWAFFVKPSDGDALLAAVHSAVNRLSGSSEAS
jgi:FixJ family two-component response regulator